MPSKRNKRRTGYGSSKNCENEVNEKFNINFRKRVVCPLNYGSRIVFETKRDADSFIEHSKEVDFHRQYKPIRSYYCNACKGYHVTSKESEKIRSYSHPKEIIREWAPKGWEFKEYLKEDRLIFVDVREKDATKEFVLFESEFLDKIVEYNEGGIKGWCIDKYDNRRFKLKLSEY